MDKPEMVIVWGWVAVAFWLVAALLLVGCASAPAKLEAIKQEVDSRITYKHYVKQDFRWVRKGQKAIGNCAVFTATYRMEAALAWYDAEVVVCQLPSGEGHTYAKVGDFALDNRYKWVIPMSQQECK